MFILLADAKGTTDDEGHLEIVQPAIADRNVTFRFTPTNYSEPHSVSLHYYPNTETSPDSLVGVPVQITYNDINRNLLLITYAQVEMNNKFICVKYNNKTCGSKTILELIGK